MADLASVTQLLWLWRTIPSLQQGAPIYVHFRVHGRAAVAETDSKAIENLAILASHLECIGACIITIAAS